MLHVITHSTEVFTQFDLILVHQSDLYFTSEFAIFSGFRVTVISRHALTSFLITMLKE
jgi:hypothetical protein